MGQKKIYRRIPVFLLFIVFVLFFGCNNGTNKEKDPLDGVKRLFLLGIITYNSTSSFEAFALKSIELPRYAGTWFEIERIPNSFQGNLSNVKAIYTPRSDGKITVTNEGTNPDGSLSTIEGIAIPSDPPKAILKVSFFFPFIFSDYYVVGLDAENYSHAMVGTQSSNILWILSRTPTLSSDIVEGYKKSARTMGYSVDLLKSYRN